MQGLFLNILSFPPPKRKRKLSKIKTKMPYIYIKRKQWFKTRKVVNRKAYKPIIWGANYFHY